VEEGVLLDLDSYKYLNATTNKQKKKWIADRCGWFHIVSGEDGVIPAEKRMKKNLKKRMETRLMACLSPFFIPWEFV